MSPDSSVLHVPQVSKIWQQEQLLDPDYLYSTRSGGATIWDKLFDAFVHWLDSLSNQRFDGITDVVGWVLILGLLVVVVYLIRSSQRSRLVESEGRGLVYKVEEQLPEAQDLDREIGEAVSAGEYRQAVRLLYRRTLAEFRDAGLLEYRPEKTDSDYVRDLSKYDSGLTFRNAVNHFQKVWYGMEPVTAEQYREVQQSFDALRGRGAVKV